MGKQREPDRQVEWNEWFPMRASAMGLGYVRYVLAGVAGWGIGFVALGLLFELQSCVRGTDTTDFPTTVRGMGVAAMMGVVIGCVVELLTLRTVTLTASKVLLYITGKGSYRRDTKGLRPVLTLHPGRSAARLDLFVDGGRLTLGVPRRHVPAVMEWIQESDGVELDQGETRVRSESPDAAN